MQLDVSLAQRVLDCLDGEATPGDVWTHPGYDVIREHAALLDRELHRDALAASLTGETDPVGGFDGVGDRRDTIERNLEHVRDNRTIWTDEIETALRRLAPETPLDDLTAYFGVGYSTGVGTGAGAYVDLADSTFADHPAELLSTVIHECTHVVHERRDGVLGTLDLAEPRLVWQTMFQTEGFATYAPLPIRREHEGLSDDRDDPAVAPDSSIRADYPMRADYTMRADYPVLDSDRMVDLVAEYDRIRARLDDSVGREQLLSWVFDEPRVPYRVGCAVVRAVADRDGLVGVREAFRTDPATFPDRYDWALDQYRT